MLLSTGKAVGVMGGSNWSDSLIDNLNKLILFLVFPVITSLGGSTDILNWGPGMLMAGIAGLLLLPEKSRLWPQGISLHAWFWYFLMGMLFLRALGSPAAPFSAVASDSSLLALASVAYLLGQSLPSMLSRALLAGLAVTAILNAACILIQTQNGDWNLIYPQRSGGFPSGLFAHYNYSASFCIGSLGLFISRTWRERGLLKYLMGLGGICALASIPLTLSRGANLSLATMVAISITLLVTHAFRSSSKVLHIWIPALLLPVIVLIFGTSLVPMLGRNQGGDGFYADGGRVGFWQAALQLAADHSWIGGGADSFSAKVFLVMKDLGGEPDKVHNEALQLAVDYGYPAAIVMGLLILAPVIRGFWRFSNGADSNGAAWESVGLAGLVVHSNFDFIFHTAPGVFLAGYILGRISIGLWTIRGPLPLKLPGMGKLNADQYRKFLLTLRHHSQDYFAGKTAAVSDMIRYLKSQEDPWETCRNQLLYFSKTEDPSGLSDSVNEIRVRCRNELLTIAQHFEFSKRRDSGWIRIWRRTLILVFILPIFAMGIRLTLALTESWSLVYDQSRRLSSWDCFNRLLSLQENHPYLGLERKILRSAIVSIYDFNTTEAREHWAEGNAGRIRSAVSGALRDPGVALQLATVLGWAGDVDGALDLYDRAIVGQGNNESLFMAHAFKGQYFYELFLSESDDGKSGVKVCYAENAVDCFLKSKEGFKNLSWKFESEFSAGLEECQSYLADRASL